MPATLPLSKISFRWQIILLGTIVVILLLAVLLAAVNALRYTKSAVLKDEQKQLSATTADLAREYADKEAFAGQNHQAPPLEDPGAPVSQEVLTLSTRVILQNAPGVDGGFYSTDGDSLVGYVESTREGVSGRIGENAPDEQRAAILSVARQAALTKVHSGQVLALGDDMVLIDALPLHAEKSYSASAWTSKKLSGLPGASRFRAYSIVVGLAATALASVLLTLLVLRNLHLGVRKIEWGLQSLEKNLGSQIAIGNDPEEIKRIAMAINRMSAALEEKIVAEKQIEDRLRHAERLAALGRLVAGVAHEVRNPLATIRLRVQMCEQSAGDPATQESCRVALAEIERLNGMVNRLLNFSQPVQLHSEPTDVSRLVEQRLASFAEKASSQGVRFVANLTNPSPAVSLDQNRIAQVFDNVIQNALEAMSDSGGTLCVNLSSDRRAPGGRSELCVEFSDSGTGINGSIVNRIFDPFFTTKRTGTGLGLSICHELVRAHGGEIQVASANGHGTTIRILLPIIEDSPGHPAGVKT
ncbi:MAG: ATP-binding protein [Candidatus Acidiferrales bacterium]